MNENMTLFILGLFVVVAAGLNILIIIVAPIAIVIEFLLNRRKK